MLLVLILKKFLRKSIFNDDTDKSHRVFITSSTSRNHRRNDFFLISFEIVESSKILNVVRFRIISINYHQHFMHVGFYYPSGIS